MSIPFGSKEYRSISGVSIDAQGEGAAVWLISLGDLLTLLLGFFIALVSLSPLNPAVRAPNRDGSSSNTNEDGSRVLDASSGTAIASARVGEPIPLFDDDFDETLLGLTAVRALSAKEVTLSEGYSDARLIVEACEAVENGERGGGWNTSAARALTVRGQLIDAGVDPIRISVRLLGPACAAITPDGAGKTALARLSFEKVRTDG